MNIYELIGVIIGDGYILYNKTKRKYRLQITGNADDDLDYFNKLSNLITTKSKNKVTIKIKKEKLGRGLRLHIDDKNFVEFLINELGLPYGNKTFTVKIPNKFLDWNYSKYIVKGICEADGCIYFSKSKKGIYPTYPRIEIRTGSDSLKNQLMKLLNQRGFKVNYLGTKYKIWKIYVSGELMLMKWVKEIGFSNEKNLSKINFWKKFGYYIPRTTHNQRLNILNSKV